MDTARYIVAVLVVSWLPPALVWWFVVHPFVSFWRRVGAKATLWILGTLMAASIVGLTVIRDQLIGTDLGFRWSALAAAAVLFFVSARVAFQRKQHLTFRILAGVPELSESGASPGTLLDQGIYSKIRHPRYVEVVVGVAAYAAFANYTGAWFVAALTVPLIHAIVLLEERELIARFGAAYQEYAARVPRYIPRRSG
ncbi:MAG: DUF1295 domain-containing protein [Gemmatimonadota bacterium]